MLTQETKRHIDAARQVLVGVVPNPSSQIDQITNALIYKFMDDMDQSAIMAGGKPSFFVGNLERYAWTRIMDSRLGNQERMNLYSEALLRFSEAKQLPELFRGIFKSAFLPYRSSEVLGLFLKEIDYFDYSHSEELGNAYEYLLSIMGSQGDAGQFRTPRHIIDFIVAAVNPTKDDKVLDPACGTAGFLVSAYKHILEQHDGKNPDGSKNNEKPLTPDQRRALMNNFEGYDVDPGMVRISQVNMYLHHFKNPKIYNYNTLTDEERWKNTFDVILANPPFMSPKGGVSTHNKFSIASNRSEVLFVDYFITHLRPKGRAGMIVPEGIIFQSASAPTALRKKLVEDGLYAVVSLPAGVFQPYAGVKTSVLLFDNERSKQNAEILFVKVENDGYDLGATKRPITKNDLPQALEIINQWKNGKKIENKLAVYVKRTVIAKTGDYNLSGDHYRLVIDYANAKWPMGELGKVCEIKKGSAITKKDVIEGNVPVIAGGQQPAYYHNKANRKGKVITVSASGAYAGFVNYFDIPIFASDCSTIQTKNDAQVVIEFVYYILKSIQDDIYQFQRGGGQPHVYPKDLETLKIPIPPLENQQQIIAELNGYHNIITGARQVVDNWKPKINIDPMWRQEKVKDISERVTKGTTPTTLGFNYQDLGINFIKIESITDSGDFIPYKIAHIDSKCHDALGRSQLKLNDVLFSIAGALGRVALVKEDILPANTNQALAIISPKQIINPAYLEQILRSELIQSQIIGLKVGVAQSNLSLAQVSNFEIPLPPLDDQKHIVDKIEAERTLIESVRKLIIINEQKIKDVLSKLWDKGGI